jgi:hypothetical protein
MVSFNRIKKGLGLTDTLTFGKFNGCRVDSLLEDEFEYLIWLHLNMKNLAREVVDKAYKKREFADSERHYNEEIAPYLEDDSKGIFDDIPF